MDVSLRHWPIFVTGLLLGAAGTMALGLHRATEAELAAAAQSARPAAVAAAPAPASTVAVAEPQTLITEQAEAQMRAAIESFRAQEAMAAASAPLSVALAKPLKPRIRPAPKPLESEAETIASTTPSAKPSERRSATSVMGAAPAEQVMPARGSAHASEDERN